MYEKLDKLRAEVERLRQRVEDDKARLKAAELKLKEAENSQIIADVGALNLTPEQLAQLLAQLANGQVPTAGATQSTVETETKSYYDYDKEEDLEDED